MPTQQHRQARAGETPSGNYASFDDVPKGTPTPTQDELNAINLGQAPELQPDGTPPDPNNQPIEGSVMGAPRNQEERERLNRERQQREQHGSHAQGTQGGPQPQRVQPRPPQS